jgi:hypothetical protein
MTRLGKQLITTARQAVTIASAVRRAHRATRSSGCLFCDIKLPVIDHGTRPYHEARDGGKRVLVPCTRRWPPGVRAVIGR